MAAALDKINAELAVAFAESGKIEFARLHIQLMRETNRRPNNAELTFELALMPVRKRLKEQLRRAQERSDKDPRDGMAAARDLLDQTRNTLALFDLFFGKDSDLRNDLFDEVARLCNQLSVIYQKATSDNKTFIDLLKTILPLAASIELRQQIEKNIVTATENLAYLTFQLRIRNDEIEITPEKFRYNDKILPSTDITGIRFGAFVRYVNGARSSVSYRIGVRSASHGVAEIECKRFSRSEEQAQQDFQAILGALFSHLVPSLCSRLEGSIVAGARIPFGDCYLTKEGIHVTIGILWWKKDRLIAWPDVRSDVSSGQLTISLLGLPGMLYRSSKSFSLRDVWNAVIFEQLANEFAPRPHHHKFSNYFLRSMMFWRDVNRSVLSSLRSTEESWRRMITAIWNDAGGKVKTGDVIAPVGLTVNNYPLNNGRMLTIVVLPKPQRVGEAYFCGIESLGSVRVSAEQHRAAGDMLRKYNAEDQIAKGHGDSSLRYFVLQNEQHLGTVGTLVEFFADKSSRILKSGLEPTESAFVDAIRALSLESR